MFEYLKVSAGVPALSLANAEVNSASVVEIISIAENNKSDIVVFPELTLTGYTAADLFYQKELHNGVLKALRDIVDTTVTAEVTAVVGAPLIIDGDMYNTAVVISSGKIKGIVPKAFLPNRSAARPAGAILCSRTAFGVCAHMYLR